MRWVALSLLLFSLSSTFLHAESKPIVILADVYGTVDGKDKLLDTGKYKKQKFESVAECDKFRVSEEAVASAGRLQAEIKRMYGIDTKIVLRCAEDDE